MAEQFSVKFDGPGVEDHTIDAGMLASSLLALTELIQETQETIDPDGPRYRVKVRAHGEGSFEVLLELREWLQAAAAFFAADQVNAVATLKTLFGGPGLFELLKFLRGKQPTRIEQISEDVIVVESDEQQREFTVSAGRLFINRSVRRNVRRFAAPLSSDDITEVSVDVPQEETLVLQSDDRAALSAPMADEMVTDETVEMWLMIDTIRFESSRWAFRDPHTKQLIRASILDVPFMDAIARREESFSKGDALFCRVHIEQSERDDGTLATEYSIVKVLDHSGDGGAQDPFPT